MNNLDGMPRTIYIWIKHILIYLVLLILLAIIVIRLGPHIENMPLFVISSLEAIAGWLSSRLNWVIAGLIAALLILWKMREPDGLFIRPYFLAFKFAEIVGMFCRRLKTGFIPPLIRLVFTALIVSLFIIVLEVSIGGLNNGEGFNETPLKAGDNTSLPGLLQANILIPNVSLSSQNGAVMVQVFPDVVGITSEGHSNNTIYEIPLPLRVAGFFVEKLFSEWAIILILWLFWEFFVMLWLRRNQIVIEDFTDHRNDKDNAVVKGLSELLAVHLSDISNLYTEINEMTSIQTTTGAGEPISTTTLNAGDLSEVVKNPLTIESKINLGLFEIPIGFLLSLIDRIFQGPKIIGCLQCVLNENEKEEIVISAKMVKGLQPYSWRVSRKLPTSLSAKECVSENRLANDQSGQTVTKEGLSSEKKEKEDAKIDSNAEIDTLGRLCEEMVSELAYRIFTDIQFNVSGRELIRWKATRKFSEGLGAYRDHLRIPRDKRIKLLESEKRFIESLTEDEKLHLAYYNLGVVYTMLERPESAEKAFMMYIERAPDSLSNGVPYYARAKSLFAINRQKEENLWQIIENLGYMRDSENIKNPNYKDIIKFCSSVSFNEIKARELNYYIQQIKEDLTGESNKLVSLLRNAGIVILKDELFNVEKDELLYEINEVCNAIKDKDYFKNRIKTLIESCYKMIYLIEEKIELDKDKTISINIDLLEKFVGSIKSICDLYPNFIKLCNEAVTSPVVAEDPRHVAQTIAEKYDEVISICEQLIRIDNMLTVSLKKQIQYNKKVILNIKGIFDIIYDDLHFINIVKSMQDDNIKKIDELVKRINVIYPGFKYTKNYDDLTNLNIKTKEIVPCVIKLFAEILDRPVQARRAIKMANNIAGKYNEIITICNQIAEARPSHVVLAKAYFLRGLSHKFKHDEKSTECHKMAATNSLKALVEAKLSGEKLEDAKEITATCLSELASSQMGKRDSSVELLLSKAKSISRNNLNIYNLSSRFYETQLRFEDAIYELEKALTLSPTNVDCLSYLALVYANAYEAYLNDRGCYSRYSNANEKALGLCEMSLDFFAYPSYETYFEKAKEISGHDKSLRRLENVCMRLNEKEMTQSIKRLFEKMKHITYLEKKRTEGADAIISLKNDLEDFVERNTSGKNKKEWWRYAQILLCLHDLCIGYQPEEIEKLNDKYELTIRELESDLLDLDTSGNEREYADTVLLLGELFIRRKDLDRAKIIKYFKQSIERLEIKQSQKIGHHVFWTKLSQIQSNLSLYESLQSAENGVKLDSFSLRTWNRLGCVLDDMNDFDNAKMALEHGYSLYPDNAIICYNMGVIYYNHAFSSANYQKMEESLRYFIKFFNNAINLFESNRPDFKFQAYFLLGQAHHILKEYESAILNYSIAKSLMNIDHLKFENIIICSELALSYLMSKAYEKCEKECFNTIKEINNVIKDHSESLNPNKKFNTSLDRRRSLAQLKADARLMIALSYLERDCCPNDALRLASSVEKSLIKDKDKELAKNERLSKDEEREYIAICRDIKGYAIYKNNEYDNAILDFNFSIKMKPHPRTYLHLALAYEGKLRMAKDRAYKQYLIESIKRCCRHVEELDRMMEYSEPRKELLQRLAENSDDMEKGDSSKKATLCE